MSSIKPLVVIIGATGNQGYSVTQSLLATGKYRVRGTTRNPDSETAKSLVSKGAEIIKVSLWSRDDIARAFQGANIVFAVTNFWDKDIFPGNLGGEIEQGKLIADVAKEQGVEWLLWSSLADTISGSNGKLKNVVHFHGKNVVEQYIRELGIPSTFIYVGMYMSNIGTFFPIVKKEDGTQEIAIPFTREDTPIEVANPSKDVGPIVAAILEDKEAWLGKLVPVAGERLTFGEIAQIIGEVQGVPTKIRTLDYESIKEFPSLNNSELIEMCQWYADYGYYGQTSARDISVAKRLYPGITTWRQFAQEKFKL